MNNIYNDGIIAPSNQCPQTLYLEINTTEALEELERTGTLKCDFTLYNRETESYQDDSFTAKALTATRALTDEIINENNYDPEKCFDGILRENLGGDIVCYIFNAWAYLLSNDKLIDHDDIDAVLYNFLSDNEFHLLIKCDSDNFCKGAIEEIHRYLRAIYLKYGDNNPPVEISNECLNPIPTSAPKGFSANIESDITQPYFISLETDYFYDEGGISGYLSVIDKTNHPDDPDKEPFTEESIENVLEIFHQTKRKEALFNSSQNA